MRYGGSFNQNRTILAGVPRATLQLWQTQLQTALITGGSGTLPVTLSYTQGDGAKSVTHRMTSKTEITGLLELIQRCLGFPAVRVPMRVAFH